jgi:hypothetical protein
MAKEKQSFLEKCYKDKNGKITLAQAPNLPIIVWVTTLLLHKITTGTAADVMAAISFGAIFTWAWMELFSGANYLRRVLGLVVLISTIMSTIK